MATTRDLIKGSLRLLGVIAPGESPTADEQSDALNALNEMLSSWSNERLLAYYRVREEFTLTSGQSSRTIGTTGNFVTSRPQEIEEATIEDQSASPTAEYGLQILSFSEWAAIIQKDSTADVPTKLYYEPTYPNGTLNLWPVPSAANKIVLYSRKPLSSLAIGDTLALPPGWEEALRYNLAVKIAPEYGVAPQMEVKEIALTSRAAIEGTNNQQLNLMRVDAALLRGGSSFNITLGE